MERSLADLAGLLLADPDAPADVFAAAGSPWFLTLFGRDSLWTARMTLPFGTDLARGTLHTLARRQGTSTEPSTGEEPGKILHEVRRSTYADPSSHLHLPPVYFGTVDATPLWVCLLHDAWRWGLPDADIVALAPHLDRALAWQAASVERSPDGLLRYVDESGHGLANQGWKDSGDSMRRRDGSIAPAPIALVETQAYAVQAARGCGAPARGRARGGRRRPAGLGGRLGRAGAGVVLGVRCRRGLPRDGPRPPTASRSTAWAATWATCWAPAP